MGVPFYGRSFLLQDASKYQPGQSAKSTGGFKGPFTDEEGFLAYYEICKLAQEPGWEQEKDGTGNIFMHNGQKWIGYDTKEAIERKMYHIRANGFGGGMTWAIDLDDFNILRFNIQTVYFINLETCTGSHVDGRCYT